MFEELGGLWLNDNITFESWAQTNRLWMSLVFMVCFNNSKAQGSFSFLSPMVWVKRGATLCCKLTGHPLIRVLAQHLLQSTNLKAFSNWHFQIYSGVYLLVLIYFTFNPATCTVLPTSPNSRQILPWASCLPHIGPACLATVLHVVAYSGRLLPLIHCCFTALWIDVYLSPFARRNVEIR